MASARACSRLSRLSECWTSSGRLASVDEVISAATLPGRTAAQSSRRRLVWRWFLKFMVIPEQGLGLRQGLDAAYPRRETERLTKVGRLPARAGAVEGFRDQGALGGAAARRSKDHDGTQRMGESLRHCSLVSSAVLEAKHCKQSRQRHWSWSAGAGSAPSSSWRIRVFSTSWQPSLLQRRSSSQAQSWACAETLGKMSAASRSQCIAAGRRTARSRYTAMRNAALTSAQSEAGSNRVKTGRRLGEGDYGSRSNQEDQRSVSR